MSTNFHIFAVRDILVIKTNKKEQQYKNFKCFQTPTSVTWNLMKSKNPIEEYENWVLTASEDCFAEAHLLDLSEWIKVAEDEGYDILWEAW